MPSITPKRTLTDIWEALAAVFFSAKILFIPFMVTLFFIPGPPYSGEFKSGSNDTIYFWFAATLFIIFLALVWISYRKGIVLDPANDRISFPASDVEISLIQILLLMRFFKLARRETLLLSEIESVTNETRRYRATSASIADFTKNKKAGPGSSAVKTRFAVNLVGVFGSRQLTFASKQKRDEFRSHLQWALREIGSRISTDRNIDIPSY